MSKDKLILLSDSVLDLCISRKCIHAKKNNGHLVSDKQHPEEAYYCFHNLDPRITFSDGCASATIMINDERVTGTMTLKEFIPREKSKPEVDLTHINAHQQIPELNF